MINKIENKNQKKREKSNVFFNNKGIVSFIGSSCGQRMTIQKETKREVVEKNSSFKELSKEYINISLLYYHFCDLRKNVALKIFNPESNLVFTFARSMY